MYWDKQSLLPRICYCSVRKDTKTVSYLYGQIYLSLVKTNSQHDAEQHTSAERAALRYCTSAAVSPVLACAESRWAHLFAHTADSISSASTGSFLRSAAACSCRSSTCPAFFSVAAGAALEIRQSTSAALDSLQASARHVAAAMCKGLGTVVLTERCASVSCTWLSSELVPACRIFSPHHHPSLRDSTLPCEHKCAHGPNIGLP
jgi:hypothetical protein